MTEEIENIIKIIKEHSRFLVTAHLNLDGDALGSELAFALILKKLGKEVVVSNVDFTPKTYNFLPLVEMITIFKSSSLFPAFEVAIVLDASDLERIGEIKQVVEEAKIIINIDHHISNQGFGHYNYIDTKASSIGEQTYELIKLLKMDLDKDIATCLYTAILTDTGAFSFSNTRPKTHRIVAELMETGLDSMKINNRIYKTKRPSSLKLLGLALSTLQVSADNKIAWMHLTQEDLQKAGDFAHTEGFIDHLQDIKGIELVLFFRETENGEVRVSFRAKGAREVNKLAQMFGGGGHPRAAGCSVKGKLKEVEREILAQCSQV